MTTKLLKMRALEDESEEGGAIDLIGGNSSKDEQAEGSDDGRPMWMKQLAQTAGQWLSLVPKVCTIYVH